MVILAAGPPPPWFAAAFPVFFVGMWVFVLWVISLTGGWRRLAASYRTTQPAPPGARWMRSGRVGIASYNNVLTVGATPEGLYLGVFVLFRPFHPPLLIPWEKVTGRTTFKWFFAEWDQFDVDGQRIRLRGKGLPPEPPKGGVVGSEVARGLERR